VLEHEGKSFVFVHTDDDTFVRHDVRLGGRNAKSIEILDGIAAGDNVVINGGFALKSQMLAALLAE
jgi:multidrug efflux pump subunit AcrA (membrane-fusion protein)